MGCPWDVISLITTKWGCGQTFAPGGIPGQIFAGYCEGNSGALLNSYKTQVEPFLDLDE